MVYLSQELVCKICSHLDDEDLRLASFVSISFRSAAEDCASRFKTHIITNPTGDHSLGGYCGFRHRLIQEIEFTVQVPSAEFERDCQREKLSEQQDRDMAFTGQLRALFAALKQVQDRAGTRNPGSYKLSIICDARGPSSNWCPHADHAYRRTHLVAHNELPILDSIRSLELRNVDPGLKLGYRVLVDLASRLPNIEQIIFHTGRDEWTPSYEREPAQLYLWEYDGLRRDARHAFGQALSDWTPPSVLKRVNLDFICRSSLQEAEDVHQWHSQPDLISPAVVDPFSKSLHMLSHHLREMTIRAQIDDSFFWPQDGSTPTWPHLERLYIMFHMVAPSGLWYLEGPRGEGRDICGHPVDEDSYPSDDEEWCTIDDYDKSFEDLSMCWFRVSPNIRILGPFLLKFAQAAANMPKLKQAVLWTPLKWFPNGDDNYDGVLFDYFQGSDDAYDVPFAWGLAYCSPGEAAIFKIDGKWPKCHIRHLWWEVGSWRPDVVLAEAFHKIGRTEHGNDLNEIYGQGDVATLTFRDDFELYTPNDAMNS